MLIKDFTLGGKIPVMGVLFINHNIENDSNPLKKVRYYKMIDVGSHPNLKEAILRCFLERLQEMTKEELMYHKEADVLYDFWINTVKKKYIGTEKVFKHFFRQYYYYGDLSFLEKGPIIRFERLKSIVNNDCLEDIRYIKNICKQNNWNIMVVNCTHKELKFPVVRVIIPPISTDSDPYTRSFIRSKSLEQQFEFLYEIKDFYYFIENSDWINDRRLIKKLLYNIEDALSRDLFSFEFNIQRGVFYQCINLFHILGFCNLAIKNYDEALKYLDFLNENIDKKFLKFRYYDTLYNPDFDHSIYSEYIKLIKNRDKSKNPHIFKFDSNPFQPRKGKIDEQLIAVLIKFTKSYF
ncbi:MAG TPA: hypothetical protein ENI51_10340 [Candidatus Atribacteria bacterium]|nr:hypothetical protein [Candidatus Atribacteria bacterium]